MPAKSVYVNLLPTTPFESSVLGKFLKWSLSTGRYLVILTEMIVIMAFLSRFKLDKDLSDLSERIGGKSAILRAETSYEKSFRHTQTRLNSAEQLITGQLDAAAILDQLTSIIPEGMKIINLTIGDTSLVVTAQASETAFQIFMAKVSRQQAFQEVSLSSLTFDPALGVKFNLEAKYK